MSSPQAMDATRGLTCSSHCWLLCCHERHLSGYWEDNSHVVPLMSAIFLFYIALVKVTVKGTSNNTEHSEKTRLLFTCSCCPTGRRGFWEGRNRVKDPGKRWFCGQKNEAVRPKNREIHSNTIFLRPLVSVQYIRSSRQQPDRITKSAY